ncbi:MAG: hypothetical protein J6Y37_04865, partial [Paludibacteraceae bacterium]|nr:hypothetical protein [Paludibacteraceae bacterium]
FSSKRWGYSSVVPSKRGCIIVKSIFPSRRDATTISPAPSVWGDFVRIFPNVFSDKPIRAFLLKKFHLI